LFFCFFHTRVWCCKEFTSPPTWRPQSPDPAQECCFLTGRNLCTPLISRDFISRISVLIIPSGKI
jgi:hypothetical protein